MIKETGNNAQCKSKKTTPYKPLKIFDNKHASELGGANIPTNFHKITSEAKFPPYRVSVSHCVTTFLGFGLSNKCLDVSRPFATAVN